MKTMTLVLAALTLAITNIVPTANAGGSETIEARRGGDNGRHRPGPGRPGHPGGPGMGRDYQEVRVNQRYTGQSILPLRQMLNIGQEDRGRKVQFVKLIAETAAGRGQAALVIDGRQIGASQTVARGWGEYIFRLPEHDNNIGDELRTLQIHLNGNFTVYAVGVQFGNRNDGGGNHGRLQENILIQRRIGGGQAINLTSLINMQKYIGMRVVGISMVAQTAAGQGDATLCLTLGCSTIQNVGTRLQSYSFPVGPGELVGLGILRAWTLQFNGNFYVDSIQIQFAR
ncbi:MAG: hypothetical protein M9962_14565 [Oligoflexia bacterium]|nr:hypothetical protein [Oligoflexia bacterium]